jgi:uncharacterized membrane protein
MFAHLVSTYHLHAIVDHFTIALLTFGIAAEILSAAAILLDRGRASFASIWGHKLRSISLLLMIGGAGATVLSYFTGDAEADRLWDTMSPAAQQILLSSTGRDYLSHAILGQRLMYAFLILAAWRVMLELSRRLERTRFAFLIVAMSRQARFSTRARPAENSFTNMVSAWHAGLSTRSKSDNRPKTDTLSAKCVDLTHVARIRRATIFRWIRG